MADYTDPKVWIDGWNLATSAPHVIVPMLVVLAVAVWWFRGHTKSGEIKALKEQARADEKWRHFAEDKATTATQKLTAAEATIATLQQQIAAGASKEALASTSLSVSASVREANTDLREVVGFMLSATEQPDTDTAGVRLYVDPNKLPKK